MNIFALHQSPDDVEESAYSILHVSPVTNRDSTKCPQQI